MIEILMVTVMIGVMVAIAVPKFATTRETGALRATRQVLASTFSAARAAAIQKGQTATLTLTETSATVSVLTGSQSQSVVVYGPIRFNSSMGTNITPLDGAPTVITYDVRGLASPRLDDVTRYEVRSASRRDTVCVSATGFILPKGCAP
jgi:Tfp pilus assembly protein FimT